MSCSGQLKTTALTITTAKTTTITTTIALTSTIKHHFLVIIVYGQMEAEVGQNVVKNNKNNIIVIVNVKH